MSVQSQLISFIQKQHGIQRNTGLVFENMYFYCTYSTKTKILSMLGTGYFLKITKINSQQEKPNYLSFAKISSRKTQRIADPQN